MRLARGLGHLFSQYVKLSHYNAPFDKVAKLELDNPKLKNALSIDLLAEVPLLSVSLTLPSRTSTNNPHLELAFSKAA
jgi:hypothetical protein